MALPKLYEQIVWHNGTTPALNEDNLNSMSQAIEDIDDRVIEIASTVMEDVPIIEEALEALDPPIRVVKDFAGVQALTDALDKNAVDVKVKVTPKQDLHGYSKPWAGGAGKNKFQVTATTSTVQGVTLTVNSDGTIKCSNNTASGLIAKSLGSFTGLASIKFAGCPSGGGSTTYGLQLYDATSGTWGQSDYGSGGSATLDAGHTYQLQLIIRSGVNTNGLLIKPMVCPSTESNVDYAHFEPYTNICPITGFTEAKVTRTGKNLFDVGTSMSDWFLASTNGTIPLSMAGSARVTATVDRATSSVQTTAYINNEYYWPCKAIKLEKNKAFRVTYGSVVNPDRIHLFGRTSGASAGTNIGNLSNGALINSGNYDEWWIGYFPMSSAPRTSFTKMLFRAEDVHDGSFEPYTGTIFTISLGDTRYLAELDVTTGVLKVTGGYIASYAGETLPGAWISDRDVYTEGGTPTTGAQVVYELATPTTVQLTATEVALLYAYNVLWADTGDLALTYDASGVLRIANSKLDIDTFKSIVASSSDFADFKSKVAAL